MQQRHAWTFIICACSLTGALAQDAHFTQFYSAPTYLSPAFAGMATQTRFAFQVRDQWPAIPGAFISSNFAVDHYFSNLNSGVGVIASYDQAGSGALRYTSMALQYAYEIRLKRKVFLRPAMQFAYANNAVDFNRLVFGDQLARGNDLGTYDAFERRSVGYSDMGAGLLFFTPQLWVGMAMHHLNEPNQSLMFSESRLPRKFSMHGGYRFKLPSAVIKSRATSIVAAFNYRSQAAYDQLDVGAYIEREPISAGLWYRGLPVKAYQPGYANHDAVAVVMGFRVKEWRFGYSYDITVSKLALNSGGSHELTMVYELFDKRKKKSMARRRVVPCAKF